MNLRTTLLSRENNYISPHLIATPTPGLSGEQHRPPAEMSQSPTGEALFPLQGKGRVGSPRTVGGEGDQEAERTYSRSSFGRC